MSEKKHELYLIAFALLAAAGLILFAAFDTPPAFADSPQGDLVEDFSVDEESEYIENTLQAGDETYGSSASDEEGEENVEKIYTGVSVNNEYTGPVNINTADKELLMTLSGIGEVRAEAIIDYRVYYGKFKSVDELLEVEGIGEKTLEKIRDRITV